MIPPFLDSAEIQRNCAEATLDAKPTQALLELAARITADPTLRALANAAHAWLLQPRGGDDDAIPKQADATFGDEAGTFRALMVLDSIRLIREKQAARGVPPEITRAVVAHQPIGMLHGAMDANGRIGVGDWMWWWYCVVGSGDLHQLGRLEFFPQAFDKHFRVFINISRDAGETIALLDANQPFNDDGYPLGTTTWTTTLRETGDQVIGHPISPRGFAMRQRVKLARNEWQQALGRGDRVLDMHIPGQRPSRWMPFEIRCIRP